MREIQKKTEGEIIGVSFEDDETVLQIRVPNGSAWGPASVVIEVLPPRPASTDEGKK